ncbi:MAG: penicillin-binding protein activator [Bdellovibrionales bacterium]
MRMISALGMSMALLVLQVGTACTTTPKKSPPVVAPQDAKKELSKIQIDVAAGADRKAASRLRNLIADHPKSDVADDATIQLARIQFKQGRYEEAYATYMTLVESDVFSVNEAEALLGAAKCLHKLGRLDESLALTARGLKIPGLSDAFKLEFHRQRYPILITMGDHLDALRSLAFIYQHDGKADIKVNAQARANEIVNLFLAEEDLKKVVNQEEFGFIRPAAAYRLGLFLMQRKDFDDARSSFNSAVEWGAGTPVQTLAQNYIAQIDSRRRVDPYTIGAVLPLNGRYSAIAHKTLRGLQLGLGIYGPERSSFRLAVVDSDGTADGARKAVERLVMEDSVIAIVGSLLSRTAASVAQKTEELGVPSIALSQKSNVTELGTYVFRNAVTSEMQMKELVRMAMESLGMKRFAILFPNDNYGVEYANLFWDEVLARGGTIAGAQPYSPDETDFRKPIQRLVGTYYVEDRRHEYQNRLREWFTKQKSLSARRSPPDDLLPPIVDFDAIFIADGPKAVGQIAPMLAYQDIRDVRLLGTNVWHSSELLRRGQKNVESAFFVDTDLIHNPVFQNSKFVSQYRKAFGEEPGLFEAQGYEAGLLLRRMIEDGERTRSDLADALSSVRRFEGVSGPIAMNQNREFVRPLNAFMVRDGAIVRWTPELESQLAAESRDRDPHQSRHSAPGKPSRLGGAGKSDSAKKKNRR